MTRRSLLRRSQKPLAVVSLALLVSTLLVFAAGPAAARRQGAIYTNTSVTTSLTPSNRYDAVTLTVHVSDARGPCGIQACGSPTGGVRITGFDDKATFEDVELSRSGDGVSVATFVTTNIAPGARTIKASYDGDNIFDFSSGTVSQTVNTIISTGTILKEYSTTSFPGQVVRFRALISSALAGPDYGGQVQFYEGGNPFGSPIDVFNGDNGNEADLYTAALTGNQTFVAHYIGNASYTASYSNQVSHSVVNPATTLTLTSFSNPAVAGQQSVIFDAHVAGNPGMINPTGVVTVYVNGEPVEQGSLGSDARCTFDLSLDIGLGHNSVTAAYGGNGTYPASSSAAVDEVVAQDATTTSYTSSANPAIAGQPVTFTSTTKVTFPGGFTPTGTVSFYIHTVFGRTLVGTAAVDTAGHASYTTSSLSPGSYPIFAVYSGDTYCAYSGTAPTTQGVDQADVPTVSTVDPGSGPAAGGATITITGTHLTGATSVTFGTTAATSLIVVSANKLTVRSPAHAAGIADLRVTGPSGTSPIVSADRYTFIAAPAITSVTPASGPLAGRQRVAINGAHFLHATSVRFGRTPATSVVVVSPTRITVRSPAHASGVVRIRVITASGASPAVRADRFTYS
jgi:hypothetical protein